MFFIGVFGIEHKQKEIKMIDNFSCKNCHFNSRGKLIKEYSFFHFFFIPLFKWNEYYYIICSNCNAIYNISKEKGKSAERGEDVNITYWDLSESNYNFNNTNKENTRYCSSCGNKININDQFCPNCGKEIQ